MEMNTPLSNTICMLIFMLLMEAGGWMWLAHNGYGPNSFIKEKPHVSRCS